MPSFGIWKILPQKRCTRELVFLVNSWHMLYNPFGSFQQGWYRNKTTLYADNGSLHGVVDDGQHLIDTRKQSACGTEMQTLAFLVMILVDVLYKTNIKGAAIRSHQRAQKRYKQYGSTRWQSTVVFCIFHKIDYFIHFISTPFLHLTLSHLWVLHML